ncbi:LOW QUALITY PROTEIN: uncharacterized protein LOC121386766 [Gigantopelta aegis]|uniref:LOW QUALITY PROTEIN: uncharacterized protein LOC121386766 n=1 Tax=Gigantopelta aegis TaxID=1735272 RepID=UPI001B88A1AE|nr:LOW QUALITY PROTEIN: uncharacterized protein LOC121386766 [Gigantopelta aegis]
MGLQLNPELQEEKEFQCSCKYYDGQPCSIQFTVDELQNVRLSFMELTREELDVAILAKLSCGMHLSASTSRSRKKVQTERKAHRTDFYFHGHRICRDTFKYLHNIGQKKLNNLMKHYKENGIQPRAHKNSKSVPRHALKLDESRAVVDFILNYAEINCIILPGRAPRHWRTDLKLLPSNCSKRTVYDKYCAAVELTGMRKVALRTFQHLWAKLVPFVSTMRPATDLCWFCQKNLYKITRSVNLPDEEKSSAIREAEDHLERASMERNLYVGITKQVLVNLLPGSVLGPHPICSYNGLMHYSFDFAQQVHYPSNPLQPGPIFFKTPRKCPLFGVCCEAFPKQINYLIDESVQTGKGANCVISLLHHFFEHYGLGETDVHLHADNCAGQNKNSVMMWYLLWRVLTGRHRSVKISFLLTGHTKFSCDWCFGLVKRLFRKTEVNCLAEISEVVNASSNVNIAQLCGHESGEVIVDTFDWTHYLGTYFRKLVGIKKYHHLTFHDNKVTVMEFADSEAKEIDLFKGEIPPGSMPNKIKPKGLDAKRRWYLYDEIRQFASEESRDTIAPLPQVPKPGRGTAAEGIGSNSSEDDVPPPPKRGRGRSRALNRGGRQARGTGRGTTS